MELDDTMLKALFAAIPILEKVPDAYRPEWNIEGMRKILAGRSSGRDNFIIAEAPRYRARVSDERGAQCVDED